MFPVVFVERKIVLACWGVSVVHAVLVICVFVEIAAVLFPNAVVNIRVVEIWA